MSKEEIVNCALFAFDSGYGSLMLQSGELPTEKRLEFLVDTIKEIKRVTIQKEIEKDGGEAQGKRGIGVAISLGELSKVNSTGSDSDNLKITERLCKRICINA